MCCPLDPINGKLIVHSAHITQTNHHQHSTLQIKAIYDPKPSTLAGRIAYFFQRVEFFEKIAELADEFYHLLQPVFHRFTNIAVYKMLSDLHSSAHQVEHFLHAFCFFGDLTRLFRGQFLEYKDSEHKKIDLLGSLSRVCHTVAHFFATARLLNDLKLCPLNKFEKVFHWSAYISASGYLFATMSILWKRHQKVINHQFKSDMVIHFGGFCFEAFKIPDHSFLQKMASVAGIVHACGIIHRLNGSIKIKGDFPIGSCSHHHSSSHQHKHCH